MRFQRLHVETDCEQATKLQVSIPITLVCFCCTFLCFPLLLFLQTPQQQRHFAAKNIRSLTKIIEAQTFVCTDVNALEQLHSQLEALSKAFEKSLPADSAGLVIPEGKTMIGNYYHYYNRYFEVVQFIKFCSATGN